MLRLLLASILFDIAQSLTVFTDEFAGPYTFNVTESGSSVQHLTSTTVTLGDFCIDTQCVIQFDFQIYETSLDLAMAGLLSKNEGDDGDRSSFSGFKITLGMLRKLRAEVSTEQTQIPSHDYVEHPLLLSTDIWYKASVNISYSWIQIYVNDIPGPVRYGNFAFVDNYGTFDIGQDVCCGEDRYRFVGSIKDIILYSDVESEPDIKTSVEMDNSDVVDHKIGAIALGIVMVIVTIGIFGYIRFDKEWQADDLKRMRQMHQAFVPPEKQKGSPAYKYEQARLAEEKRKREFKNAPQFYEKTLN